MIPMLFWTSPEANLLKFWFYIIGVIDRRRTPSGSSSGVTGGSSGTPAESAAVDTEQAAMPEAASMGRAKSIKAK